jgi:hypothetical protein
MRRELSLAAINNFLAFQYLQFMMPCEFLKSVRPAQIPLNNFCKLGPIKDPLRWVGLDVSGSAADFSAAGHQTLALRSRLRRRVPRLRREKDRAPPSLAAWTPSPSGGSCFSRRSLGTRPKWPATYPRSASPSYNLSPTYRSHQPSVPHREILSTSSPNNGQYDSRMTSTICAAND